MFQKGDILKCINGIDYTPIGGAASKVVEGVFYHFSEYHPTNPGICLVETGSNSWCSSRFELVAQQDKNTQVPQSILAPTGDSGAGGSAHLPYTLYIPPFVNFVDNEGDQSTSGTIYQQLELGQAIQTIAKCECGVDSIGGGKHSTWCPKHNQGDNNG